MAENTAKGTHRRLGNPAADLRGPEHRGAANAKRREAEARHREGLRSIDDAEARAKSEASYGKKSKAKGSK